jgi:hypothetical protein
MTRWWSQYIFLTFAAIFFGGGVVSTLTGTTLARFRGVVYRAKNPSDFWWTVATYYLLALFFVYMYLSGDR